MADMDSLYMMICLMWVNEPQEWQLDISVAGEVLQQPLMLNINQDTESTKVNLQAKLANCHYRSNLSNRIADGPHFQPMEHWFSTPDPWRDKLEKDCQKALCAIPME